MEETFSETSTHEKKLDFFEEIFLLFFEGSGDRGVQPE